MGLSAATAGVIGNEALFAGTVFAENDYGLGDAVDGGERGFDFAELDAEAVELDLLIEAAEELERPSAR